MTTLPWNKKRIIGQKRPLQISNIWGIRIRLELEGKVRDLALFNLALDSKLRGCDLVKLKVSDVAYGHSVSGRATVWIKMAHLRSSDYLFQSRVGSSRHISTRQYNRIFHGWIDKMGLDETLYSTHSIRRTKPYLIYKKTKNLRVIQLLLGHKKNSKVQSVISVLKWMMPWRQSESIEV
jgi:integrase